MWCHCCFENVFCTHTIAVSWVMVPIALSIVSSNTTQCWSHEHVCSQPACPTEQSINRCVSESMFDVTFEKGQPPSRLGCKLGGVPFHKTADNMGAHFAFCEFFVCFLHFLKTHWLVNKCLHFSHCNNQLLGL